VPGVPSSRTGTPVSRMHPPLILHKHPLCAQVRRVVFFPAAATATANAKRERAAAVAHPKNQKQKNKKTTVHGGARDVPRRAPDQQVLGRVQRSQERPVHLPHEGEEGDARGAAGKGKARVPRAEGGGRGGDGGKARGSGGISSRSSSSSGFATERAWRQGSSSMSSLPLPFAFSRFCSLNEHTPGAPRETKPDQKIETRSLAAFL